MTETNDSWLFLREFFLVDKESISNLISQAVRVNSNINLKADTYEELKNKFESYLPIQKKNMSYNDFLSFVAYEGFQIEIENTKELEDLFLNRVWYNIAADSSVNKFFSKRIRENFNTSEAILIPYLIFASFKIEANWFLFGGKSKNYVVDDSKNIPLLFDALYKRFKVWNEGLLKKLYYKIVKQKTLSINQLYPLTILFIILRREFELSKTDDYIKLKYRYLRKSYESLDLIEALLMGLYDKFENAHSDIINEIKSYEDKIEFNPLISKHIIETFSYKFLYMKKSQNDDENKDYSKNELFKYVEDNLGDDYNGKRLLIDWKFPYTKIRENDVFLKAQSDKNSILDMIFVSFSVGNQFSLYWRVPHKDELFDKIQIFPMTNSSNEYDDTRLIAYRDKLSSTGDFLVIKTKEDTQNVEILKTAFSNFRHDLKDIMHGAGIEVLQNNLNTLKENIEKLQMLIDNTLLFIEAPKNEDLLKSLRGLLKDLDNDISIKKLQKYNLPISKMRDIVEDIKFPNLENAIRSLRNKIQEIRTIIATIVLENISKQILVTDKIKDNHDTLCSYIEMAGSPNITKKETFEICGFIENYIKFTPINNRRAEIKFVSPDKNINIVYNKTILKIILNSILGNAHDHGFKGYNESCPNPIIEISIAEIDNYVILKIANNGRPIEITEEEYKTRGVFSGPTGHTGLGGYQISKYAEQFGGYIKLPANKQWNTEIDLYIKHGK